MGAGGSRQMPPVVASCPYPPYCVRMLGSRHVLLAGGGGAAKCGVGNQLDAFIFELTNTLPSSDPNVKCDKLKLLQSKSVNTKTRATMNLDVAVIDPSNGRYLIAAGQDDHCVIYRTEFDVNYPESQGDGLHKPKLTFSVIPMNEFRSDKHAKMAYQKVARFKPMSNGQRLVTAGADGHFRLWKMVKNGVHTDEMAFEMVLEQAAHKDDIDDLDISPDGKVLVTVGHDAKTILWSLEDGKKLLEVPVPTELGTGFRVRSCRFTRLGDKNLVFVTAHTPIQRGSKNQTSFLALWAYSKERNVCRPIIVKAACDEPISTLNVSECGEFTAIGTMSGSVGVFDTHEMRRLMFAVGTHGIFVTGVELVPTQCADIATGAAPTEKLPGVACEYRTAVVSVSADQTVQFHVVPFPDRGVAPLSTFFMKISCVAAALYLSLWAITT